MWVWWQLWGCLGLGQAPLLLSLSWLLCQAWCTGMRWGRGYLLKGMGIACSQPSTGGFFRLAEETSGAWGIEGAFIESLWLLKEHTSVFPSLKQAGINSALSKLAAWWGKRAMLGAGCWGGGTVGSQASVQDHGDA